MLLMDNWVVVEQAQEKSVKQGGRPNNDKESDRTVFYVLYDIACYRMFRNANGYRQISA